MNVEAKSSLDTHDGQKVYTPFTLLVYNLYVLRFSNRFVWRSPSQYILDFYQQNITMNHLDVGVGTGYFLNKVRFPAPNPHIGLLDLNPGCLAHTANLLSRYQPSTYQADILQPIEQVNKTFDSIAANYLLHCLPGDFTTKSAAIGHLKSLLNDQGVLFGTTILAKDQKHNFLGKKLITIYNQKGIFGNLQDDLPGLESMLKQHFSHVEIHMHGHVAFFKAWN